MTSDDLELAEPDLPWLVDRRCKIQQTLLELYGFNGTLSDEAERRVVWPVYGLLIGAAFSLWRAVFLAFPRRAPQEESRAGIELLKELIETNAIAFPQDRKRAQWTSGYYINNARLRLAALLEVPATRSLIDRTATESEKQTLRGLGPAYHTQIVKHDEPTKLWDEAFDGLEMAVRLLAKLALHSSPSTPG